MAGSDYLWAKRQGGKTHIVKGHEPTTLEVNDYAEVEERLAPLCGKGIKADTHRFKGFDKHRGLDFCAVCTKLYHDREDTPTED